MSDCPFCQIIRSTTPQPGVTQWTDEVFVIEPLHPVTYGHQLVVPRAHVEDLTVSPVVTVEVVKIATAVARIWMPCNVITSAGEEATQTVFHLHVHVVPRRAGDGLALPWTGQ